ncbi:MAG: SGNH/GDSL hydrolase family protein [Lentisphaerae bacterium]|nr:SGNH/GDSL hydrolase family protein [Lentisphaerota bacterium]
MRTILAYGDSNTWGVIPGSVNMQTMIFQRYGYYERWSGIVRRILGKNHVVIDEGLNGRTTVFDDPLLSNRNGASYLLPSLFSHSPIDLLIIMLGTNDLKLHLGLQAVHSANGIHKLIKLAKSTSTGVNGTLGKILIISPPLVIEECEYFMESLQGAARKSKQLAQHYQAVAALEKCHFINTAQITPPSLIDGIHLDKAGHEKLGKIVAAKIESIFA